MEDPGAGLKMLGCSWNIELAIKRWLTGLKSFCVIISHRNFYVCLLATLSSLSLHLALNGWNVSNASSEWLKCIQCERWLVEMYPCNESADWLKCIQCELWMVEMYPIRALNGWNVSNESADWLKCIQWEVVFRARIIRDHWQAGIIGLAGIIGKIL